VTIREKKGKKEEKRESRNKQVPVKRGKERGKGKNPLPPSRRGFAKKKGESWKGEKASTSPLLAGKKKKKRVTTTNRICRGEKRNEGERELFRKRKHRKGKEKGGDENGRERFLQLRKQLGGEKDKRGGKGKKGNGMTVNQRHPGKKEPQSCAKFLCSAKETGNPEGGRRKRPSPKKREGKEEYRYPSDVKNLGREGGGLNEGGKGKNKEGCSALR